MTKDNFKRANRQEYTDILCSTDYKGWVMLRVKTKLRKHFVVLVAANLTKPLLDFVFHIAYNIYRKLKENNLNQKGF